MRNLTAAECVVNLTVVYWNGSREVPTRIQSGTWIGYALSARTLLTKTGNFSGKSTMLPEYR